MRTLALWLALAAGVDDGPTYGLILQLDNVWGPTCIEAIENGLRRLEGVVSAKAQGFRSPEKYYYDLQVKEEKALTPAVLLAYQKKHLAEYDYLDLGCKGLAGTVEQGVLVARGSKQRYALKAGGAHEKLVAEGKTRLAVTGKVTQGEKGDPLIEVAEAVEIK